MPKQNWPIVFNFKGAPRTGKLKKAGSGFRLDFPDPPRLQVPMPSFPPLTNNQVQEAVRDNRLSFPNGAPTLFRVPQRGSGSGAVVQPLKQKYTQRASDRRKRIQDRLAEAGLTFSAPPNAGSSRRYSVGFPSGAVRPATTLKEVEGILQAYLTRQEPGEPGDF